MENTKRPPMKEGGEETLDVMPEALSFYYMKCALLRHYKQKYPEQKAVITEICEMVGSLLGAQELNDAYACGGGVGMIRGWDESILEIEANH